MLNDSRHHLFKYSGFDRLAKHRRAAERSGALLDFGGLPAGQQDHRHGRACAIAQTAHQTEAYLGLIAFTIILRYFRVRVEASSRAISIYDFQIARILLSQMA